MRRFALFVVALAIGCSSGIATPAREAREIESRVWSPYCPGRLLADCTTRQARELRDEIETRLERGDSPDAVMAWIRHNHGDEALADPSDPVVWVVPGAVLLLAAVGVATVVRRWTRRPVP